MCGFAGFFDVASLMGDGAPEHLVRMLSSIRHRGPDEQGIFFDERCGLGVARLSIIDLAHGQQPMTTEDLRYAIAFNGEIFNYLELRAELEQLGERFTTRSDTEVLLVALIRWGDEALARVNGQFAFAFYDRRSAKLSMARDPYGERPLFFARHEGGLVFGSEIKALFACRTLPRRLSVDRLRRAYRLWTVLPDETVFEGIDQIAPGHLLTFENGKLSTRPYYRFPPPSQPVASKSEAMELVRTALEESVRLRLRSDVEVGAYSSGGLDSTITTYLAQRNNEKPVRTFAIGFEDAEFDETQHQETVQRHLGTQHHAVRISLADIAKSFPDVVWHAETALFRTAPVPMFLLAKLVREVGIKVVLTGEGADEAFLGYNIFRETLFRRDLPSMSREQQLEKVHTLYPYLSFFSDANAAALLRAFEPYTKGKKAGLFSHEMRFANGAFAARLLAPGGGDDEELFLKDIVGRDPPLLERSLVERAQILEYATLLGGYLLSSQGDRMTSAWGVEGRCPFLDPNVVALAFSLAEELRLAGADEKHILKAAFREVLPPSILSRPKQPYRAPDAEAFIEVKLDWIDELVGTRYWERTGLFDKTASAFVDRVLKLPKDRIGPREDHATVLLFSTMLLHRMFIEELPAEPYARKLDLVRSIDARGAA